MAVRLLALTCDTDDPARLARFWGGMLRREAVEDGDGLLLPGTPTQVGLRFVSGPPAAEHAIRLHLHVTSASLAHQPGRSGRQLLLAVDEDGSAELTDPDGKEFCLRPA